MPATASRQEHVMPASRRTDQPTAYEMVEEVVLLIGGTAVAAPMLPGFLFCVPFLLSVTIVALLPVVAVGLVVAAVAAVVAIPVLLVRAAGSVRMRWMSRAKRRSQALAANVSTGLASVVGGLDGSKDPGLAGAMAPRASRDMHG